MSCIRLLAAACALLTGVPADARAPRTRVGIEGAKLTINGQPTYRGRVWKGKSIEGLLFNARMVQATFDDLNPKSRALWAYPDTKKWDADRNTSEFIAQMPEWRRHGLLAFTLNLQGGSPQGYSKEQPWHNSALKEDGSLRPEYLARLARVIERADQLDMVVILGIYYFGQDERLEDEDAVKAGVDATVDWLIEKKYTNVLVEINNECNVRYDHAILKPDRVHELIVRVQRRAAARKFPLLVSTSYGGGQVPRPNVVKAADFLLLHGNGVSDPARIAEMVRRTRKVEGYRPMPILFNEDDHFDFDRPRNNFRAAVEEQASWGYFDYRMKGEGFDEGYQSVPVNWKTSSRRKKGFFRLLGEITGTQMHFPRQEWEIVRPEAEGLDAKKLADAVSYLKQNAGRDGVKELVVVRRGRIVWHGDDIDKVHGIWSCTKSFTSTVLGLLIDDGKCTLDTRAAAVLPVLKERYPEVTLRHFTTMTSGYTAAGDEKPKGGYLHGPSDTPFVPGKPLFAGENYAYWDSAMNQFGLVLTTIADEPLDALLKRRILEPLGVNPEKWKWGERKGAGDRKVNSGSGNGGGHVQISAREMARFGLLFLNEGSWDGKQLISKEWVRQATSVQVKVSLPEGFPASKIAGSGCYGFNWWVNGVKPDGKRKWLDAPAGTCAAMGHNNNLCLIVPDWQVVVVRLGLDQGDRKIEDAVIGQLLKRIGESIVD